MADVISDTIARVRELDAAATKGPWEHGSAMCCPDMGWVVGPRGEVCPTYEGTKRTHTLDANDAELIAYYRTAAPALATECERLRERVEEAEDALLEAQTERDRLQDRLDAYEPPPRPRKYV